MTPKPIANRTRELVLFQKMVTGQHPAKILLIEAASGMGKSWLLRKFREHCAAPTRTVSLDLKGAELGIPYIFNWVCEELGYTQFPKFQTELRQMVSGAINFANNQMEGEQTIQIALNVDETTRKYRLSALQRAFFEDLGGLDYPVVLLLDTFQLAVTELQNWIESELLRRASRLSNLIVVVAGQQVPNPENINWYDFREYCCLKPIEDEEAWFEFAKGINPRFEEAAIKAFVRALRGNPRNIHLILQEQAEGW